MNYIKRGSGNPLLLIHGLGGSWRSWNTILDDLAKEREVIAIDLPGFGDTAPLIGEVSIKTLSDSVTTFLKEIRFKDWMLFGKIDYPAYFSLKIQDKEFLDTIPQVQKMYEKNGFVFYKRMP